MPGASHIIGNLPARHRAVDSATSSATSTAKPSRAWRSTSSATTYSILTRLPGDARLTPADAARLLNAASRPRCAEQLAHP